MPNNEETLFAPQGVDPVSPTETPAANPEQGEVNYLEQLVGEGRKYADENALAKAVVHAQAHIERLEQEQAGLREDLSKSLKLEEVVNKMTEHNEALKAVTPTPGLADPNPVTNNETIENINPGNMTPEQIQELVQNQIKSAEQVRAKETNMSQVKDKLREVWGNNYANTLAQKASDLNVGTDFLDKLAAEQPKAFLELVGANKTQEPVTNVAPPSSSVTIGNPGSGTGTRNKNYYTKMRRENPQAYWDPKTQMQMHEDASNMGDSFYN